MSERPAAALVASRPARCVASWDLRHGGRADDGVVLEALAGRLARGLAGGAEPRFVWLGSGGPARPDAKRSFLASHPVRVEEVAPGDADAIPGMLQRLEAAGGAVPVDPAPGGRTGALGAARDGAAAGFGGGWIGFLAYEAVEGLEPVRLAAKARDGVPLASFGLYLTWFVYDHVEGRLALWSRAPEGVAGLLPPVAVWKDAVGEGAPGAGARASAVAAARGDRAVPAVEAGRPRFERGVRSILEAIREGEVFQANLAHRVQVPCDADPLALFARMRAVNPSPFMFLLVAPWGAIVSNSPERLFAVEPGPRGARVVARPIAGTRPRGKDEAEERAFAAELLGSEKERAEHVMLVDLARNDIGRVSEPGSVVVEEFLTVERYSHVLHLVSEVSGRLRAGVGLVGLLRALFPGGTVTGAPKLRSIEVIDAAEPVPRGPYTGSAGYIGLDGAVDLNILIRTVLLAGGVASLHVGAGIVADSDAAAEFRETMAKARAVLAALGVDVEGSP